VAAHVAEALLELFGKLHLPTFMTGQVQDDDLHQSETQFVIVIYLMS
jgi:hypothetical protein